MSGSSAVFGSNPFTNWGCVHGIAFFDAATWVKCAQLSVICAVFELSQDKFAHFGRIECLPPPHRLA